MEADASIAWLSLRKCQTTRPWRPWISSFHAVHTSDTKGTMPGSGRICVALVATVIGLGLACDAGAQAVGQFDLNQFRPSELTTDGFALSHADGQGHLRFGFQLYIDYARDPLELRVTNGPIPDQRIQLVHTQLTGHLTWSLGLWKRLVLFMDLPYTFVLDANLSDEQAGFIDQFALNALLPAGRGLGDLYVGARGVLYGDRENVFQLAAQVTLTANTASASRARQNYLGEAPRPPNIGGWFEALGTFNAGRYVRIPLNVGYKTAFRQDIPSLGIGNQLTYGAAVQVWLGQERFMLTFETFGRTAAARGTGFGGRQETPVELLGGFKYLDPNGIAVGVAGTGGVTQAYGNPDWRMIAMFGYTMRGKPAPADTDSDGIADEEDDCPTEPEDFDGFEDEDGCPEFDNDSDGVLDVDDACPNQPGPPENDGCPEEPLVVIEESRLEILDKIYFDLDSAKLQERSYAVLDGVAAVLNAHPEIPLIRIEGHTDSTGGFDYNMRLSRRRAAAVVQYLVTQGGVRQERLVAEGFGETRPLIPNAKTKAELAENRRVEFQFTEPEEAATVNGDQD